MAKIKSTDNNSSKRDVIINVAADLFKEKGYKASSMRELATRVGVEAASLYNHIKSKDELLKEICFAVLKKFHTHIERLENEKLTGVEKVEKIVRFHVNEMMVNYEHVYVTDQNWRMLEEPGLTQYRELRRQYRRRFSAIVQKGIDANEIKQSIQKRWIQSAWSAEILCARLYMKNPNCQEIDSSIISLEITSISTSPFVF